MSFLAIPVFGWNVTILQTDSTSFTLQWTSLDANVNHSAKFYIIEVKSNHGILLAMETVPGNSTFTDFKRLRPSTKYHVAVYGVDETGQPYKSLDSHVTTNEVSCGFRPSKSRIVGGTVAKVNSWPWQVMLKYSYGGQFCGGSLVDSYWVVTAAHCVDGKSPSSIKIRLGAHYRTSGSVGTEQDIDVAKIIMHESYETPNSDSNDIALIKLVSPADLGVGVGLVCLPDTGHQLPVDNVNKKCWITGWGRLSSGGSSPNSLMQASVPLVSKQRCINAYPGKIDDSMLCAGLDIGGVDTCQGDSGGPLVCEFNGTWYLEGVTSWGYGCARPGKYGVYAKVRNLKPWLLSNVVPPTQNQSSSALGILWCNFENGLCDEWNQSSSDDFDWTLASGSTPSSSTGPSSGHGGSGNYMYIEASSPRKPGENAKLVLTVPNSRQQSCLSFYYHMYGATAGSLNVYSGNNKVFNVSGDQGNKWKIMEINIYLQSEITFEGITGRSHTGDIAIDEVKITEGKCPVSCNFDRGLCFGWTQSKLDDFDWTLYSGSTPSSDTGPSSDHGGSGMYLYTEATGWYTGANAKLQFAVPRSESPSCLMFFYHMYGSSMGTLNVYNGNVKIFSKSGDQGNVWKKVTATLHPTNVITFEGIIGSSFRSDIAIDDVTVMEGNCPGCGGVLNESSGELEFGKFGDEGILHCNWTIGDAGIRQAVAILSLQRKHLGTCSELIKVFDSNGAEVFARRGCDFKPPGLLVEIPFAGGDSITLAGQLSYAKVWYIILNQSLSSATVLPGWTVSADNATSTSILIQWTNLTSLLKRQVHHYIIFLNKTEGDSLAYAITDGKRLNTEIDGLQHSTTYIVQVFGVDELRRSYRALEVVAETEQLSCGSRPSSSRIVGGTAAPVNSWPWQAMLRDSSGRQFCGGSLIDPLWVVTATHCIYGKSPSSVKVRLGAHYRSNGTVGTEQDFDVVKIIQHEHYNIPNGWSNDITLLQLSKPAKIGKGVGLVCLSNNSFQLPFDDLNNKTCWITGWGTLSYYGVTPNELMQVDIPLVSKQRCTESYPGRIDDTMICVGKDQGGIGGCHGDSGGPLVCEFGGKWYLEGAASWAGMPCASPSKYTVYANIRYLKSWIINKITSATTPAMTSCDFDLGLCSDWQQSTSDVFNWTRNRGSTPSGSTGPSSDHTTGSGYYMYIETSNPRVDGDNAKLELSVSGNGEKSCLEFYYHMYGDTMGTLTVFSGNAVVFNTSGNHGSRWRKAKINIYLNKTVTFEGLVGSSFTGDLAIDDVSIRSGRCVGQTVAPPTTPTPVNTTPSSRPSPGCGGYLNQSFGELQVGPRGYSSSPLRCNWAIGKAGIDQAVLLVSLQDLYLIYYSEYIKIIDGNGSIVFYKNGYLSSPWKTFWEVKYGNGNNVTVEINLTYRWSRFKLRYGIVTKGLQSALPVANWNVSIDNITQSSIVINWPNLTSILHQPVLYYFGLIKSTNGSILNEDILSGNTSSVGFNGLSPYREYRLSVVGVNGSGQAYKSAEVIAWTEEGVPSRGPSNVTFTNVGATEITVHWNPLPEQYVNGRLLGYRVVYAYSRYNISIVNVTDPNATWVTLTELKPRQLYYILVTAFTSKGEGPFSYSMISTAMEVIVNQSTGFINVTHTDYFYDLYSYWTIGNVGETHAVAIFLIQDLDLRYCREYVKIFDGNGTLQFYQAGCGSPSHGSLVEVPFGNSNNITVKVVLSKFKSHVRIQFVVFKNGLNAAAVLPDWTAAADNTTSQSILIRWTNLTSLLNRQVLHYIIFLNKADGNALAHKITDGKILSTEIDGLQQSTTYRVQVFGVDELGRPYKTLEVNAETEKLFCGSRPSIARIVGGTVAPVNSWPWQAMLINSYGYQFCGGSLIDPLWVVTATHCIYGKQASSVTVRLGAHYRSNGTVGTEQTIDVVKIIQHEHYNIPNRWSNDIALLQLSKPAKIGKGVGLACLSNNSFQLPVDDLNKPCWITGWGMLSYPGSPSNELMQVDIPIVSNQRCNASYPGKIDDSMICVGKDQGGVGGCKGDSGGPLVCEFNGKWYLEGATSWGGIPCASPFTKYTVYANIRNLKSWIINRITPAITPALTSCDFDLGLCPDWQHSDSGVFNWTRNRGSTPTSNTGPSSDHTTGSGYYMYIETSYPRVAGDNAKLVLNVSGNGALSCLEFYYHMYGDTMGTLTVFSGKAVVFNTSGDHGPYWQKAEIDIYLTKTVTFEGIVGSSLTGDLAIDDVSIRSGSCVGQTAAPPTPTPGPTAPPTSSTASTRVTPTPTHTTPETPSIRIRGRQQSVILKIQGLDMNKWDKNMENDFKVEVAKMATAYCAADFARCQLTPTSSRRRRSSNNLVFSSDMVHILPGYPIQSPDDPMIALLEFYLQMPQGFSDNVVHRDALKAIVKSDMSGLGRSMGSTIVSVQPKFSTTELPTDKDKDKDDESMTAIVIIGVSVGGVFLLVITIVLILGFKRSNRLQSKEPERAEEADVKGSEGVYEGVDEAVMAERSTNNAYDNHTYVYVEQAAEAMRVNRALPSDKKTAEEHNLRVITHHALINEGFQNQYA
ncbi:hypothetical protein ACROYT_G040898 [Oculina patagonica]